MAATVVGTPTAYIFNDGDAGKSLAIGSPNVGETDYLCVNSNTTVATPSGFTLRRSDVANQGAYIFERKAVGGEGSSVVVDTNGDHNTFVGHVRLANVDTFEVSGGAQANASVGGSTPALSLGPLAATGEAVIAFAALHSIQSANQSSPTWSSGYTALLNAAQGTGATGVRGLVAVNLNAGTAAENPSVSWSGDGCFNRYMLAAASTALAGTVDGVLTGLLPALIGALSGDELFDGALAGALPGLTGALTGDEVLDGVLSGALPAMVGALAGDVRIDGALSGALPALVGHFTDGALELPATSRRIATSTRAGTRIAGSAG